MVAGAGEEWRKYWTLPLAGSLGNSLTVITVYSLGGFMEPLNREFGWTRAEISAGLTVQNLAGVGVGILCGILIDRYGPRRVGLPGATLTCMAIALLGTATGSLLNWYALWAIISVVAAGITPVIWTSAVASRFDASRGLAMAIVVSGAGVAATITPPLTAWLLTHVGWRGSFAGLGLIWGALVLPPLFLFFRGAHDRGGNAAAAVSASRAGMPGLSVAEGLRSSVFYRLGLATGLFSFVAIGLVVHFLPILRDSGLDLATAAAITGMIGLASLAGRFGTGFLLDRFDARYVAAAAFVTPTASALLLLSGGGRIEMTLAALTLGFSLGAELDVAFYLATRYFGLRHYGVLLSSMIIFMVVGVALGPVTAGAIFDAHASYARFLWLAIPMVLTASLLIGTLSRFPDHGPSAANS